MTDNTIDTDPDVADWQELDRRYRRGRRASFAVGVLVGAALTLVLVALTGLWGAG